MHTTKACALYWDVSHASLPFRSQRRYLIFPRGVNAPRHPQPMHEKHTTWLLPSLVLWFFLRVFPCSFYVFFVVHVFSCFKSCFLCVSEITVCRTHAVLCNCQIFTQNKFASGFKHTHSHLQINTHTHTMVLVCPILYCWHRARLPCR